MYESFFNLERKPFELLPNPDFLFLSRSHKRALSYLDYGIKERVGFILLTGEVGSGKTTIIRNLIKKNHENVILSKIFNTLVDSDQLIAMINDDFGLPVKEKNKITLLRDLNDFLIDQFIKGNKPVLIIDEAQNLAPEILEEIRMLSNLETDSAKLLQIILVGQPELRKTLASPSLVQLRQRISINCHIQPLSRSETEEYILFRLEKAGDRSAVTFPAETHDLIFTYSRGIPRLINIICDFLLLSAFAEDTRDIDVDLVKDIIGDLDFEKHFWGAAPPPMTKDAGDATPAPPSPPPAELTSVFRQISERIESVGRENVELSKKMYQEVSSKIALLENSLKTYQDETSLRLASLQAEGPAVEKQMEEEAVEEESDEARPSLFKRMFRF